MTLSTLSTPASQQYSIVLASMSYADSPYDALRMFFHQLASGHVTVEIHNSDTDTSCELDELGNQNLEDQASLALDLIKRHGPALSAHSRLSLLRQMKEILEGPDLGSR